ncbi:dnaB protein [Lactobacillus selangorensis]|uniref:DnaB protein n=1 Tax=Lactobacillus selangorensis TaxID=81857 RepID=A0A0R2FZ50_9LACO|nr:DnaD domain protein [Lactobacillus selangorensis]KRN29740.1 dnaB protein [Lactobacillus selangorensis]KRN33731.1 dnaB protein [Lactobacillus selangorensis]
MNDAFAALSPHDGFLITKANYLSDFDQRVLTLLYQPLMGVTAYSLYLYLWSFVRKQAVMTDRVLHSQILSILDIDLPTFYENRLKLEGLGLLRTYQKDDEVGRLFVYELYAPLAPDAFFKDDLLRLALYQKVDQHQFEKLVKETQLHPVTKKDFKEVTKNFLDVFQIGKQAFTHTTSSAEQAAASMTTKPAQVPAYSQAQLQTFDWETLKQFVWSGGHISGSEIDQNQAALFNLHQFYNLSEIDLAHAIARTMNVADNTIDMPALERVVLQEHTEKTTSLKRPAQKKQALTSAQEKQLQQKGYSEREIQILKETADVVPLDYLQAVKEKKHGIVGKGEIYALRNLENRYIFSDQVIAILIVYLVNNYQTITQNLLDRVADSWIQAGVKTGVDALNQIRAFKQPKQKKQPKHYTRNGRPTRQEKLPDWAQDGYQKQETKQLSSDEQKELAASREAVKKMLEGGQS